MRQTAKLFMNGRSQAVRLPSSFRFDGNEVYIRKDPVSGDVILSKKPASWDEFFDLMQTIEIPAEFMVDRITGERTGSPDVLEHSGVTHPYPNNTPRKETPMSNQPQFTIGKAVNVVQKSKEIGSNTSHVVGVQQAEVTCSCGHQWTAYDGNGLHNVVGGVHITCPSCNASGQVHARMFRSN